MKQRRAKDGDGAPTNGELDWMRTTRQYRRTLYADAAAMHLACSCPDATAMASRGRPTEDAVVVVAFVKSYSILFQMRCRFWCLGPQLREVQKRPGNCLLYIVKETYLSLRRALPWQLPPQPRTFAQDKPHFANGSCTFKFNCPPVLPSSCHCIKSFVAAPGPATDP